MGKNIKKNKVKKCASKTYVGFAIAQFIITVLYSLACPILGFDGSNICYILPSSATVLATALAFYYNKAKMENLSKQRIRYVYLKMLLENKLTPDQYNEINFELENIDSIINDKLNYTLQNDINEDINNNI